MSTGTPLLGPSGSGLELTGVGLESRRDRITSRRGLLAIAGVLISGAMIAVGAAHTSVLLPQTLQYLWPAPLGGLFRGLGVNLHSGGAIAALALMFVSYWSVVSLSAQISPRVVLTAITALILLLLVAPPLISTDIFSYQAYARMGALYSIDPYTHGPHGIALDSVVPYVGAKWVGIPSAYGPVFTVSSYLMAPMSIVASVFAYKAIAALSCFALVALVWRCAKLRGKDPVKAVALVGLNPLVMVYGVGGGHNDLLMLVALVGGLYAVLAARERPGAGLMIAASGVKLTAGVVLPFALAAHGPGRTRSRRDLLIGTGIALTLLAALSLIAFGWGSVDMLKTINRSQSEGDWQTIPGFLSAGLGLNTIGHIVGYVLAAAFLATAGVLLRRVWRGRLDWIDGAGWATLWMLVASSSLLPWYVGWLMPLAALGHDRRLSRAAMIMTGVVLGFQLVGYIPHATGML